MRTRQFLGLHGSNFPNKGLFKLRPLGPTEEEGPARGGCRRCSDLDSYSSTHQSCAVVGLLPGVVDGDGHDAVCHMPECSRFRCVVEQSGLPGMTSFGFFEWRTGESCEDYKVPFIGGGKCRNGNLVEKTL